MKAILRVLGVIFVIYASVMAVMGLQYLFDRGDLRKASQVISQYKPKGSDKPLMALMAEQFGVTEDGLDCRLQLLSRYEGRVEVDCRAKGGYEAGDNDVALRSEEFRFEVDVVGAQLRALNDLTKALVNGKGR